MRKKSGKERARMYYIFVQPVEKKKKKKSRAIQKVRNWKGISKVLIKFSLNLNSFSQISLNFEPNKLLNKWGNEFFIPPLKLLNKKNE